MTETPSDTIPFDLPKHLSKALQLLRQGYVYAQQLDRDVWDFSVELPFLRELGLTSNDLRWLVYSGYIEHGWEITLRGENGRRFRRGGEIFFSKKTCFVLTEPGARAMSLLGDAMSNGSGKASNVPDRGAFESDSFSMRSARESADLPVASSACTDSSSTWKQGVEPTLPTWDRDRKELKLGLVLVKQFKLPSPNQERILAAFEEEKWACRVDDPLPFHPEMDAKRRLHDTIKSLNRNQKNRLICFIGDGSGEGVRWETIPPSP